MVQRLEAKSQNALDYEIWEGEEMFPVGSWQPGLRKTYFSFLLIINMEEGDE